MKKVSLLLPSLLMMCSLTAYAAGETREPEVLWAGSDAKTAGSYKIAEEYRLTKALHGVDGMIQLLQDSRLDKSLYGEFGWAFALKQEDQMIRLFKDNPPLGAVLRVLKYDDEIAEIAESLTFDETPVAWLEEVRLSSSGKPSYLLTRDTSTGIGAHSGPKTSLYEVAQGKLRPIEYVDSRTKRKGKIALVRSMVTNWELVKSKDGKSRDILYTDCEPDTSKDPVEFKAYYRRYHFSGKKWVKYEREEEGYWEVGTETLPPLSKFPPGP